MAKRCVLGGIVLGLCAWLAGPMVPAVLGADKPDGKKVEVKKTDGKKTDGKKSEVKKTEAQQSCPVKAEATCPVKKASPAGAPGTCAAKATCKQCSKTCPAGCHKDAKSCHHKGHKHHGQHGHKGHRGHGKGHWQKGCHGHHGHHGRHGHHGYGHCQRGGHGHDGHHGHHGHHGRGHCQRSGHGHHGHHGKHGHHGRGHCQRSGHGHHGRHGHHGHGKGHRQKGGHGHHGKSGRDGRCPFFGKGFGAGAEKFRGMGPGQLFGPSCPALGFGPPPIEFAMPMLAMPVIDHVWDMLTKAGAVNKNGVVTKESLAAALPKIVEHFRQRMHPPGAPGAGPGPGVKLFPGREGVGGPGAGPAGPGRGGFRAAALFVRFDKKKDGKLTKDEVPGPAWEFFTKIGAVKDGAVTKESLQAAGKKMHEKQEKEQQPPAKPPK